MLLYRWQGAARNFGDELNTLLWPRLLPGFFDDNPAELFLGIGSVLDVRHPADAVKVVAGAGYGGYEPPPKLDARWVVHWVRGPRTASRLGLPAACGIGDPAMLLPVAGWESADSGPVRPERSTRPIGFMPHFESATRGAWVAAAATAGVELIDPRGDPDTIVAAIRCCRVLLSEALHGAIVADALRVPWIALQPLATVHRAKWLDWADSLDLQVEFRHLAASSLLERLHNSRLGAFHHGHRLLDVFHPALCNLLPRRFVEEAGSALSRAAAVCPQLSSATALARCQARMLDKLVSLRRDPRGSSGNHR
jgi:succinoglycan biosynthesis protein ExoV